MSQSKTGERLVMTGTLCGLGWGLFSTVHTLVRAPLTSVVVLGSGAAMTAAGAYACGRAAKAQDPLNVTNA